MSRGGLRSPWNAATAREGHIGRNVRGAGPTHAEPAETLQRAMTGSRAVPTQEQGDIGAATIPLDVLGAALASAEDAVILLGEDRLLYANQSAASVLEIPDPAGLIGRPWLEFFKIDQQRHLRQHVLPEFEESGRFRGEVTAVTASGRTIYLEVTLTLVEGTGVLVIGRDTSDRQRRDRRRQRLWKRLFIAEREQVVSHFAASIVHDLNNLMAIIRGSALLMRHAMAETDEGREHADRIAEACVQAAGVLDELTRRATRRPEAATIDLRDSLQEALDLMRTAIGPRVVLLARLPKAPLLAEARGTAFVEVALTLLANAGDMLPGGTGRIEVELAEMSGAAALKSGPIAAGRLSEHLRYGHLIVMDTGRGVPPDLAERLLDAFFTSTEEDSSLLGLAVICRIAEAAGGAIRLGNRPGGGAVLEVFWPLLDEEEASSPSIDAAGLEGKAVVVVDDEPTVAQLIAASLEAAGAIVATCTDPREALAAVEEDEGALSLLVTDHDMPGMNGQELARRCRTARPGLPILLCTAVMNDLRGVRIDRTLFAAILRKPFDPAEVVAHAADAIARTGGGSARRDEDTDRGRPPSGA